MIFFESTVRHGFKGIDEIYKEDLIENGTNNVITKSVSTPVSMQAIVRVQNDSNIQHKVCFFFIFAIPDASKYSLGF